MNNFKKAFLYIAFFLVCIAVHFLIMRYGKQSATDFNSIYIFTTLVCALTLLLIVEVNSFFHKHLGFIFIGVIALKLFAAKMFMDNSAQMDDSEFKFSFIILYLISLVLITLFTAKLLLNPEK